jgi:hypothetical protein
MVQTSIKKPNIPLNIDSYKETYVDDNSAISNGTKKNQSIKKKEKSRPLTISKGNNGKKPKTISIDEMMLEYGRKREQQAETAAAEVRRHNKAMEDIAMSTAMIEKTKKDLEIGVMAKTAIIDNERKNLDFKLHKLEKFEELKAKGLSNLRIATMFPSMKEFMEEYNDAEDEIIEIEADVLNEKVAQVE